MPTLKFKKLRKGVDLPSYSTSEAAGMDIKAADGAGIALGETRMIRTGLAVEIPFGWELQCRSRSGLASKGIVVANSPGTIDSDYRGELCVILHNQAHLGVYEVHPGDRIAQLVLAEVPRMKIEEVEELSETDRGEGGFGSTGING